MGTVLSSGQSCVTSLLSDGTHDVNACCATVGCDYVSADGSINICDSPAAAAAAAAVTGGQSGSAGGQSTVAADCTDAPPSIPGATFVMRPPDASADAANALYTCTDTQAETYVNCENTSNPGTPSWTLHLPLSSTHGAALNRNLCGTGGGGGGGGGGTTLRPICTSDSDCTTAGETCITYTDPFRTGVSVQRCGTDPNAGGGGGTGGGGGNLSCAPGDPVPTISNGVWNERRFGDTGARNRMATLQCDAGANAADPNHNIILCLNGNWVTPEGDAPLPNPCIH